MDESNLTVGGSQQTPTEHKNKSPGPLHPPSDRLTCSTLPAPGLQVSSPHLLISSSPRLLVSSSPVMASPRLLLLMLMSSSFVLSGLSTRLSSDRQDQHALQKRIAPSKIGGYIEKAHNVLFPVFATIQPAGPFINALIRLVTTLLNINKPDPTMALIKTRFDELNVKLDTHHGEMKWEIWATVYHQYETKIKVVWGHFKEFIHNYEPNTDQTQKQKLIDMFKKQYKSTAMSTIEELHEALTSGGKSFTTNIRELLTTKAHCHENIIKQYSEFIDKLFLKGSIVSYFYYTLNKVDKLDQLANKASDVISVMYEIHKHCIIEADKYIKTDIEKLMAETKTKDHTELAKEVRSFLDKAYDRYNFIAVGYITDNSGHKHMKTLNKHFLSGFTPVEVGTVTVAVAKQLKGTHTIVDNVIKIIQTCVNKNTMCVKVVKELQKCRTTSKNKYVAKIKLSSLLTAIHVYNNKVHDSVESEYVKEVAGTHSPNLSPVQYIYRGECTGTIANKGGFHVLIKSDEEILKTDPCKGETCGGSEKGTCVVLKNTNVAACDCKNKRYDMNCEKTLEDYKKEIVDETPLT